MGKKKKAPPPPDYKALATQQAALDKAAATEQTVTNRPDQNTAWGSTKWTQDPNGRWTENQTLNPADQAQLDRTRGLEAQQQDIAGGLMGRARDAMSTPLDYGAAPELTGYDMSKINMPTNAGFEGNKEYEDAIMSRMRPDLQKRRDSEMQRLRNQGIYEGSEAFNNADMRQSRTENDAQQQAILAGADEHAKGFARQLQLAQEQFGQQGAMAGLSGTQRQQKIAEINALRNSPMQDYQQFTQGTEVTTPQMPNFMGGTGYNAANMYGAAKDTYQAQVDSVNAKNAMTAGLTKGLMGMGGSWLGAGMPTSFNAGKR